MHLIRFDVSVLDVFYALGKCCGTLCSAYKDTLVSQFAGAVNAFAATMYFPSPEVQSTTPTRAPTSMLFDSTAIE